MIASLLALLPLALGAAASPVSLKTRQVEPTTWCPPTLGGGIFDIGYNFTLAAVNTTLPNANSTGVPIAVGFGGATEGAEFHVLSVSVICAIHDACDDTDEYLQTYATYPYDDFPSLSLLHGALHPNSPNDIVIASTPVFDGDQIGFIQENDAPAPAQIYCGVVCTSI